MSQGPDLRCVTRGISELGSQPFVVEETGKVTKDCDIISSNPHSPAAGILLVEEIDLEKEEAMPWSQI